MSSLQIRVRAVVRPKYELL